jgi:glycosyltransferase involved in cell wall biosynthesis
MRFVFYSPNFYPLIGGLENVVMDLATELSRLGHAVRVLTLAPANEPDAFPFEVVRGVRFWQTVRHIRWGERLVQVNVSLNGILPYLLVQRPLILFHQNLYPTNSWIGRLKWAVSKRASVNIGCSAFIAQHYKRCYSLGNPYNEAVFKLRRGQPRTKNLIFLGRLVSDKGCDVLLRALEKLKSTYSLIPALSIVGEGPERGPLEHLANELGVTSQVTFEGSRAGTALADTLNQHTLLIVPSVYEEPFGIVALEGIACGCFVIGSRAGGLPEAIGPCGATFPLGDAMALADVIYKALNESDWRNAHQQYAPAHLEKHRRAAVAERFLSIINKEQ